MTAPQPPRPTLRPTTTEAPAERSSARVIAYEWLLEAITALPWDQEAFLNEVEIAEASGTSRTPVREALLRLEAAGLIKRVPNKGAYVPALSDADIDRMMEARVVIETWAIEKIVRQGFDTARLHELLRRQSELADEPLAFIDEDIRFHRHIVDAADNPALARVYQSLREQQRRLGVSAVQDRDGRSDHVVEEHRAILDAIDARDPDAAQAALRTHLVQTRRVIQHAPHARPASADAGHRPSEGLAP